MRCEEVRPLLPDLAEGRPRAAGAVEAHLASCDRCAGHLALYRDLLSSLEGLRDEVVEPPPELLDRLLADLPATRPGLLRRAAASERVQHAAFSLGGAVIGATAVGLLWWRARRSPAGAAGKVAAGL